MRKRKDIKRARQCGPSSLLGTVASVLLSVACGTGSSGTVHRDTSDGGALSSGGASTLGGAPATLPGTDSAGSGGTTTLPPPSSGGTTDQPTGSGGGSGGGAPSSGSTGSGGAAATTAHLFWLAITGNQVLTSNLDGSERKVLVSANGISGPDGVTVDSDEGKIYWTNMGTATDAPHPATGSVERANLDGTGVEVLVQPGQTNTPKQMQFDRVNHKIYWSDREGARAYRANLDGTSKEVLLSGHEIQQLVGMALDVPRRQFYVSDRYARNILRVGFDLKSGETADNRTDVETLVVQPAPAMPIDLDLDLTKRQMYWTDRAQGTVFRAPLELSPGETSANRKDIVTLLSGLSTPIGLSLGLAEGKLYFTELLGHVFVANLDGSAKLSLADSSGASGITRVDVPTNPTK